MRPPFAGYASAVILRNRVQSLVLGAPRYQHIGLVVIFKKDGRVWEASGEVQGSQVCAEWVEHDVSSRGTARCCVCCCLVGGAFGGRCWKVLAPAWPSRLLCPCICTFLLSVHDSFSHSTTLIALAGAVSLSPIPAPSLVLSQ